MVSKYKNITKVISIILFLFILNGIVLIYGLANFFDSPNTNYSFSENEFILFIILWDIMNFIASYKIIKNYLNYKKLN